MLVKLIRLGLFLAVLLLLWNAVLKPETRQRFRGHIVTLAYAMLLASCIMGGWHWWRYGSSALS